MITRTHACTHTRKQNQTRAAFHLLHFNSCVTFLPFPVVPPPPTDFSPRPCHLVPGPWRWHSEAPVQQSEHEEVCCDGGVGRGVGGAWHGGCRWLNHLCRVFVTPRKNVFCVAHALGPQLIIVSRIFSFHKKKKRKAGDLHRQASAEALKVRFGRTNEGGWRAKVAAVCFTGIKLCFKITFFFTSLQVKQKSLKAEMKMQHFPLVSDLHPPTPHRPTEMTAFHSTFFLIFFSLAFFVKEKKKKSCQFL